MDSRDENIKTKNLASFNMRFLNVLYFLIVFIAIASCGRKNGKQVLYPRLNNYYMVEYLDNRIILSQMTKTDTLNKVNNEIFMSDGSLLFSTIRDTTFKYYVNGYRIEREILKAEEGYKTISNIYTGHDMISSVSFFYNKNYEITEIHQIEKVEYLPQKSETQCVPHANTVCFYPQMRTPKTFYTEYLERRLLVGSSSNHYVSDTFYIDKGEIRDKDGRLWLSTNRDTIMRSCGEDGEHQEEIRKIRDNEYVYSNYLIRYDALGSYVYGKKGGVDSCYFTGNDSVSVLLVSYTYTRDFRILKRQSFEEVKYLPQKE